MAPIKQKKALTSAQKQRALRFSAAVQGPLEDARFVACASPESLVRIETIAQKSHPCIVTVLKSAIGSLFALAIDLETAKKSGSWRKMLGEAGTGFMTLRPFALDRIPSESAPEVRPAQNAPWPPIEGVILPMDCGGHFQPVVIGKSYNAKWAETLELCSANENSKERIAHRKELLLENGQRLRVWGTTVLDSEGHEPISARKLALFLFQKNQAIVESRLKVALAKENLAEQIFRGSLFAFKWRFSRTCKYLLEVISRPFAPGKAMRMANRSFWAESFAFLHIAPPPGVEDLRGAWLAAKRRVGAKRNFREDALNEILARTWFPLRLNQMRGPQLRENVNAFFYKDILDFESKRLPLSVKTIRTRVDRLGLSSDTEKVVSGPIPTDGFGSIDLPAPVRWMSCYYPVLPVPLLAEAIPWVCSKK